MGVGGACRREKQGQRRRITRQTLDLDPGRPIDYMPSIAEDAVGRVRGSGDQREVELLLKLPHVIHTRSEIADGVR